MIYRLWDKKRRIKKPLRFDEPQKKGSALEGVDPRLKQIAFNRLAVLREYNRRLQEPRPPKSKLKLLDNFLTELDSGLLSPAGGEKFFSHIGRKTIYNWQRLYKNGGLAALVPRYKTKLSTGKAEFQPLVKPIEIKFHGPPRCNRKVFFLERLRRRWKNPPLECPIRLGIFYSMPVPKGIKMSRRMKMLKHQIFHTGKPNLDTLNAFVVSCMTGIVFKDHSQIVEFHSKKEYAWWPQMRILLRGLKG